VRDAITWYVVVQVLAMAAWPVVSFALAPLDDRGWAAAKAFGVLLVAWLVWLVCMLTPVPFTRATLLLAVVVVGAAAWGWLWHGRTLAPTVAWMRERRGLLLTWEVLFAVAFILFAELRAHEPAIAAFEKPMDMAFVNGFMAAQRLPTQDTWLSGYSVPYYHFGYFVAACLGKLTGADPGVAYNLAAATIPALATIGMASLAWSLARAAGVQAAWSAAGSAAATLLALYCGNLRTFFEWLYARGALNADAGDSLGIKRFGDGVTPGVWPPTNGLWWFSASRVIPTTQPDGINEFPFFTAFLSDLHPHFVAIPFELLVLSAAAAHVISRGATLRSPWTQGLAAVSLGGLLVMNTWDIAPFWVLYVGLSLFAARFCAWRWRWLAAVATPFAGVLLYSPYFIGYGGPPLGLGIATDQTPLSSLLVLFGWALVLLAGLGLFMRWCIGDRRGWAVVGVGVVIGLVLALLGQPGIGLLAAVLATLLPWPGVIDRFDPVAALLVGIGAFAVAMLLGVELVYLDDVFHSRMNTVFKFDENAWLLAGLAAGTGLALLGRFTLRARWIVAGLACVFVAAGLYYPVTAIVTRMAEPPPASGGPSLDGLNFLSADDRAAIRWLSDQNSARGRVVIAEALGNEYDPNSAGMATYSGAATVLGWAGHELQWRGPLPVIGTRQADLAALYRDAPTDQIQSVLDRDGVQYVVVGDQERHVYGDAVTSRFDGILPVAFRSGGVTIYRAR
jgi:YYY domain-containing protein